MKLDSIIKLGVAAFVISAVTACSEAGEPAAQVDDIIGGKRASTYPEAVLVNMLRGGKIVAACSGALVAPEVVLTAGHCVHGWQGWQIVAPGAGGKVVKAKGGATYDWNVEGEIVDPSKHDVGLVFLASPITLPAYPKLGTRALSAGDRVLNIGRIQDGALSNASLFVSKAVKVRAGAQYGFPNDYVATDVIQSGDSGGPDVLPGPAPHTIVAVNSGANEATEVLARVDLVAGWISAQIAAHTGDGKKGPAAEGAAGCAHDPCAAGKRLSESCDACAAAVCAGDAYCCAEKWDEQCVAEAQEGCGVGCGEGGGEDGGCGTVTEEGECVGDVVTWCDDGVRSTDCGEYGLSCGWDEASGVYGCL